jgi:hypothetical protein
VDRHRFDANSDTDLDRLPNEISDPDRHQHDADPQPWYPLSMDSSREGTAGSLMFSLKPVSGFRIRIDLMRIRIRIRIQHFS